MNMGRSVAVRSIFLGCLRENATNMRREHEDLGRRIAVSLANSRRTLANIENMNHELQKMKETIHNALNNIRRDADYENKSCQLLLSILCIVVDEFGLEAKLNPKIVSQMFIETVSGTDEPVLQALDIVKDVPSLLNTEKALNSSQDSTDITEPLAGPKPLDAAENTQPNIPGSNSIDMERI
ncbi:uncharacterized protein LOC119553862 [Drosophila subpulchrella]|uniref:uncharacterized protein LOC119553862 n=1 Tax=Drosophila subpulchrella TaxID=1486046 RepID=UPI0018A1650B|nr:uncharacterized protein LOC119553862 [Drosophila subpulchrella]